MKNLFKSFASNINQAIAHTAGRTSKSPCDLSSCYRHIAHFLIASCALALSSCAVTPDTSVKQPMTAKPGYIQPAEAKNGGIYSAAAYKPLFEDRRARAIGDIITITITENTAASKLFLATDYQVTVSQYIDHGHRQCAGESIARI